MERELHIPGEDQSAVTLTVLEYVPEGLPSLRLRVALRFGAFAGSVEGIYVGLEELEDFASQLQVLERTRRGAASLASLNPGELALTVRAVDASGHLLVEAALLRSTYRHGQHVQLCTAGAMELESSRLPPLVAELRALLGALQR